MIDQERKSKKLGWEERVRGLEEAKEKAETITTFENCTSITDIFPGYEQHVEELKTCLGPD